MYPKSTFPACSSLPIGLPPYPLEATVVQLTGPTKKRKKAYRRVVMAEHVSWVCSLATDIILLAVLNLYTLYMDGRD
ncbi:hypothetical protein B296_00039304 [Ensete ventricosum]|uniref:Uncharacterized protein n=1 Tax=Ensete ventricosum TaxID=4639 RepID=A0A426ZS25_ENSVE|nr:hypothetical protein B296_00039304 [Ensete ventricosum]